MFKKNPLHFYRKIRWSCRKIFLPISRSSLVLEVGSGGNPHPYSTVLVEKYISNKHRLKSISCDNRLIIADACKLPFRDLLFDYSMSFHVLEHVNNPASFLDEMQRTSKAGYIETPSFLYERFSPFPVHLLEVALSKDKLHIRLKESFDPDYYIKSLDILNNDKKWMLLFNNRPDLFHVQYFWEGSIDYFVYNPETSLSWFVEPSVNIETICESEKTHKFSIRGLFIRILKAVKSDNVDLDSLLVCPECKGVLMKDEKYYLCDYCKVRYKHKPYPDFISGERIEG